MQIKIFHNLLTASRSVNNTCAQVVRAQSCACAVVRVGWGGDAAGTGVGEGRRWEGEGVVDVQRETES